MSRQADGPRLSGRRRLLHAMAGGMPLLGTGPWPVPLRGDAREGPRQPLRIIDSALPSAANPQGRGPQGPFRKEDFNTVGVLDADWLLDVRYARLLDHMAASPGAFGGVRFFGALNSGERDDVFPTTSGHLWPHSDAPMDFSATLDALAALVSRNLVPFIALTFFPTAVSASPIAPPEDFIAWQGLVRSFLDQAMARFGPAEVAHWWFEAWNEPNMPNFWSGSFDRYLDLYRATSEAILASGHRIRLGGPVIAYMPPQEGAALMKRFLEFLRDEPEVKCDFLSLHRKGIWVDAEAEPRVERLLAAAEATAEAALRLVPERCRRGLPIVNDEADMKVGFAIPYEPRLTEQFPAWLAAVAITYDALSARYADRGLRFIAASDNANQHLVRAPFDGRRSLMTRTDAAPEDLLKLPVFAFYELLRLLGDRHGSWDAPDDAFFPDSDLFHAVTVAEDRIGAIFVSCPDGGQEVVPSTLEYTLRDIPWSRANLVQFRIDDSHANAFTTVGRRMPAPVEPGLAARRIRASQELGIAAPMRSGLPVRNGSLHLTLRLAPFTTILVWVTPHAPHPLRRPDWISATQEGGNVILRWAASREPHFYSYRLRRIGPGRRSTLVSPVPLRAAMWVDTAPPAGRYVYALQAVSASGVRSATLRSDPFSV